MGPIMGSVLFKIGGFTLPFYTVGVMLLGLAVVLVCLIDGDSAQKKFSNEERSTMA